MDDAYFFHCCPIREYFAYIRTSLLRMNGQVNLSICSDIYNAFERYLPCHTYCDTGSLCSFFTTSDSYDLFYPRNRNGTYNVIRQYWFIVKVKYHYTQWLTLRITLSVSRIGDKPKNVTLINKHSVYFNVIIKVYNYLN